MRIRVIMAASIDQAGRKVNLDAATRGGRFSPMSRRVRPGALWPLPGRPAAR